MKFRRWPHGVVSLILLLVAVVVLVSLETGASTSTREAAPTAHFTPFGTTAPAPGSGLRKPPKGGSDDDVATGSDNSVTVGAGGDPRAQRLTMNPFNFRLGLINGTVVEPDARDFAARTVATGPLLLFLPATGHVPDDYRSFLTVAAESGYHVLGLDFWNRGKSVADTCGVDARCYTQVQRNRLNGSTPSQFSKVDEANSVLSRLHAALDYLVDKDPDGGWSQYTDGTTINWSDIVVAGHSQGGGEAAYIAHQNRVLGQLTFSSPIITDKDVAASWLKTKGKTPASRMYGFDDTHDEFYPRILPSWHYLGMGRHPLVAEIPVPTSSSQHELLSTLDLGNPTQAHIRSVADSTPRDKDGTPVFEPVWKWMLAQVYPARPSPSKS